MTPHAYDPAIFSFRTTTMATSTTLPGIYITTTTEEESSASGIQLSTLSLIVAAVAALWAMVV